MEAARRNGHVNRFGAGRQDAHGTSPGEGRRELPGAVHDFGWVLWEFREFAAICRSAGVVLSVVMAID